MKKTDNIIMPNGMDKQKFVELLLNEEYGTLPTDSRFINAREISHDRSFCAGKAALFKLELPTYLTEEMPEVGGGISEGYIGYHIRSGSHYLSREDWNKFISFLSR